MRSLGVAALACALFAAAGVLTLSEVRGDSAKSETTKLLPPENEQETENENLPTPEEAADRGIDWLVSVQGADGGWGQDGGETSYVRQGENLEATGNDVANTAVAAMALIRSGHTPSAGKYKQNARRAVEFVLRGVENAPEEGLRLATLEGTQIQRKLGRFIDTFLAGRLLGELDGETGDAKLDRRVRAALEKCVAKIEANQSEDGSWNRGGGWAPILGTSFASQSLDVARRKGVRVDNEVLAKADDYGRQAAQSSTSSGGSFGSGSARGSGISAPAAAAGVALYNDALVFEQLSRSEESREANKQALDAVARKLSDGRFQAGYGSMGGEEFFSYLNISDSLRRTGGERWRQWNGDIRTKLVRLQNNDGSWAGHHCITGRVAVTGAAVLTMLVERMSANEG